ncbi:MAG: carboxypeptidase-like regulatory domain-containing protein, partial [Muribaculum sp.]|nr:carboxypeptidase-like regulatory domain-containing protein [Muribaculum sp.]
MSLIKDSFALICRKIVLISVGLTAYGQVSAADIKGSVTDSDNEPLIQATIRLLKANADSTFVKGTTSDIDGKFTLAGISAGKYILSVNYIGYTTHDTTLQMSGKTLRLAPIKLQQSSIMLKEAVVKAVKTPIVVKEDTVEFNA